jgi:hypothetical protein
MGYYLEPQDVLPNRPSNAHFLETHAKRVGGAIWPTDERDALICLMDNGAWLAAGVCYSQREMEAFNDPNDVRKRTWYWLSKERCYDAMRPEDADSLRRVWNKPRYEPRHR